MSLEKSIIIDNIYIMIGGLYETFKTIKRNKKYDPNSPGY